jgi:superfamily II DNA or RNA helicase
MNDVTIDFDTKSMEDYRRFLALKSCPQYWWLGESANVPKQYASIVTGKKQRKRGESYTPRLSTLFDYQRDIAALAISKRKFAVFADCGLGKTLVYLEFALHAAQATGKRILIVAPLMVCDQIVDEAKRFYGESTDIGTVSAASLPYWIQSTDTIDTQIGVTNYEAIREGLPHGHLGALILDESSMLKSHYGAWGTRLIDLGRGVEFKMACTGTPAPNDRIEYANHAVFLDHFRTVNEFLARYFINRGETANRWELKPHALRPFYRDLSHWCIFLSDPSVYGWKDNCGTLPPINVHIHQVALSSSQRTAAQRLTGTLLAAQSGGIGQRAKLAQIAKGKGCEGFKTEFIANLIESWPTESTLTWCRYNEEQETIAKAMPLAGSIEGSTSDAMRRTLVNAFKAGELKTLISKPKILGFGLNLQVCTRQVFSSLQDSYEEYYQAVKRSNRVGSTRPLNVHIPVTELEEPMIETVLRKADRVEQDTRQQELLFKEMRWTF